MPGSATARAQAVEALQSAEQALDEAASLFKRQARAARDGLVAASRARDSIRQARINALGVTIETITAPVGGTDNGHGHEAPGA